MGFRAVASRRRAQLRHKLNRLIRKSMKRLRKNRSRLRAIGNQTYSRSRAMRGRAVSLRKRLDQFRELEVEPYFHQRQIDRELASIAHGSSPIIVGPWISEVGYEVLYWVPFLRWFVDRWRVSPSRIIALSRGGTSSWYSGVADQYVEILKLVSPQEFVSGNEKRVKDGDQKQMRKSSFDEILIDAARQDLGLRQVSVLHPSLMFQTFRSFWYGRRSLDFLSQRTQYSRVDADPLTIDIPKPYVAVKFYTGAAIPPTAENREILRALVRNVAGGRNIVNLDTGFNLDEHEDFLFKDVSSVLSLRHQMSPQNNLALQTSVIAGASLYLGTCGGLAWLAPMLGTPTTAVYSDDKFLRSHLYAAPYMFRGMGAAPFAPLDLKAFVGVGLGDTSHKIRTA